MQTLDAQMRCVPPPQDILSCVTVGVVAMSASDALEGRLALATSGIHDTAGRADQRREGRVNLDDPPSALLHFVGQDQIESAPTLVEDSAVETGLLPNHPARLGYRASGRGGHVPNPQILQYGDPEAARDVEGGPVVEITADATRTGLKPGDPAALAGIPLRAPLAAGEDTLSLPLGGLDPLEAGGHGQQLARGQRQRGGHAPINPDGGSE